MCCYHEDALMFADRREFFGVAGGDAQTSRGQIGALKGTSLIAANLATSIAPSDLK